MTKIKENITDPNIMMILEDIFELDKDHKNFVKLHPEFNEFYGKALEIKSEYINCCNIVQEMAENDDEYPLAEGVDLQQFVDNADKIYEPLKKKLLKIWIDECQSFNIACGIIEDYSTARSPEVHNGENSQIDINQNYFLRFTDEDVIVDLYVNKEILLDECKIKKLPIYSCATNESGQRESEYRRIELDEL